MYQPLTKEQFQKARDAGFTPDKILAMEQKRKAEETTTKAGDMVRGAIKPFAKVAASGKNLVQAAQGKEMTDIKSKYLGDVPRVGKGFDATKGFTKGNVTAMKDAVGTGAEIASWFPGAKAAQIAGKGLVQPGKQIFKQVVKGAAKEAGTAGAMQGAGSALQEDKGIGGILTDATIGGVGGAVGGGVLAGAGNIAGKAFSSLPKLVPKSASIMQKVSRTTPSKQANFERMAGEKQGDYLTNRGIFGDEKQVMEQLYDRFSKSKTEADEALATLPGEFKSKPLNTALTELAEREARVSTPGAPSQDLARAEYLKGKHDTVGLTMTEVNEAKRMYERNVKLDFVKQNMPESIARANNIDTALRMWQFDQANKLGLKNLPAINQETRLAKQLLDDMGRTHSGKAGNDMISLSDWILLSGGDPTALGSFLTKKIFSSKGVQGWVAKKLAPEATKKGITKAEYGGKQGLPALIPGMDYSLPKQNNPKFKTINMPKNVRETNMGIDEVKNATDSRPRLQSQSEVKPQKAYDDTITQKERKVKEIDDPLHEWKTMKGTYSDEFKGKSEVREAIKEIGGLKNVTRKKVSLDELKPTEKFDLNNNGVQRAMKEIKSGKHTPLIVDENMDIIDGNHRYEAYKNLGTMNVTIITPKKKSIIPKPKKK